MKISFAGESLPSEGALVILASEGPVLGESARAVDQETGGQVSRAMAAAGYKGAKGKVLDIVAPSGLDVSRVLVAGLGDPAKADEKVQVDLGGTVAGKLQGLQVTQATLRVDNIDGLGDKTPELAARLAFGARLRSHRFDRYKTKAKDDEKPPLASLSVQVASVQACRRAFKRYDALADGICLARELIAEPANVLYPAEFAKRLSKLDSSGLEVKVLGEKDLAKIGMSSLLAVGAGSQRDSQVVVMEWKGGGKEAPLAFVGKGVTFDTGGISLKPGSNMGDMKGDMSGAAAVSGLMLALAGRKAKVNAVGIVGLVENMPDGRALRPGDVIDSLAGKTIEVLNTDAEGRLVLADVLTYTQSEFKPRAIVDLATLTGAIVVSLGHIHAGMFASDDELAAALSRAGEATGEKVWRMPLADAYDKMLDSKIADMKNIGGRDAGSITAAQFLKRFVGDVPWAHLDIAGTALNAPRTEISQAWSSGFGVRLLDRLVADEYEQS